MRLALFLVSFTTLVRILKAEDGFLDDVMEQRAKEARKNIFETYVPDPLSVADDLNSEVNKEFNGTGHGRKTLDLDLDDDDDVVTGKGPRRSLMHKHVLKGKKKYKGPCEATNPIDKCWRCRSNWAQERKRLADCGLGFGRKAIGGKNGRFYVVTDPSDNDLVNPKPGTLRHAVIQREPLWIIFAHDMNIKLNGELLVTSHKTIDGRGACVHISHGAGITLQFVQNVIIHSVKIHHISAANGGMIRDSVDHYGLRTRSDGDGISIFTSSNIWIDHVCLSTCADGLIDVIMGSTGITISNCHFTHHDEVILLGASDSYDQDKLMQVTVAFNHFGQGLIQRMPRCRWGFVHVVNNDYTHWKMYAIGGSQNPTIVSQGNRFIAPDDQNAKEVTYRVYAPESEWKNWNWRSEDDVFENGAFFNQSGNSNFLKPHQKFFITAKPGIYAPKMTRFAGSLLCKEGKKC